MTPPVVWIITRRFIPFIGGGQIQAYRQAKALHDAGVDVRVLTQQFPADVETPLPGKDTIEGVPVYRVSGGNFGRISDFIFFLRAFWLLCRQGQRGIYHAHGEGLNGWLALLARYALMGRSVMKLRNNFDFYNDLYASRFAKWQFYTLLRHSDRLIAISSVIEQSLHEIGIPAERIVCIPNGIDTTFFCPANSDQKTKARQQLGLPHDKFIVLSVGVLKYRKGMDVLLNAWKRTPETLRQQAVLVIVGDGEERNNLQAMIETLDLGQSVILTGEQVEIRPYYWASDLFVLSSRAEGLSNALLEGCACGLPVIVSNISGSADVVENGKNGFLFASEDDEGLSQQLMTWWSSPDQGKTTMGAASRKMIEEYASLDTVVAKLNTMYQQLSRS